MPVYNSETYEQISILYLRIQDLFTFLFFSCAFKMYNSLLIQINRISFLSAVLEKALTFEVK